MANQTFSRHQLHREAASGPRASLGTAEEPEVEEVADAIDLGSHMHQGIKLPRKNGRRFPTRRLSSHRPYCRVVNPITIWQASKGEVEKGNTN